jgi:NAD+ diphosphatase
VVTDGIPEFLRKMVSTPLFIGSSADENWMVHPVNDMARLPDGYSLVPLRSISPALTRSMLGILGRAIHLVRFDSTTQFCGRCGAKNQMKIDETAKICPSCGLLTFPRISPAIIVRITAGDRILLASSPHFPSGMYSILAGFVEPGESLESCVQREVYEEVGVKITDLSYFGSQPWPFPDSLMIGFCAEYLSGEIVCDGVEISDAAWFTKENMPELPGSLSISRALIDDFLKS